MLKIKDLSVFYGPIHALKDISIEVKKEIVTLIGSSGAGKSTTLGAITGLVKTTGGSIIFNDIDITNMSPHKIVQMGIVSPEGREVFPALTVEENLRLGAYTRKNKSEIEESFERVYDLFPRLKEGLGKLQGHFQGRAADAGNRTGTYEPA